MENKISPFEDYAKKQTRTDPDYDVIAERINKDPQLARLSMAALLMIEDLGGILDTVKRQVIYGKGSQPDDRVLTLANQTKVNLARFIEPRTLRLVHMLLGLGSEPGELAKNVIDYVDGNSDLDEVNVGVECGDVTWYVRGALNAVCQSYETCHAQNHAKLLKRFPEKFTEEAANERDVAAERVVEESFVTPKLELLSEDDLLYQSTNRKNRDQES